MAKKKISGLPAGSALNGTELVPIVQAGTTKRTTTQDIADLGNASSVSGSGTINRLAKFTASSTLGDSAFFDDGTNQGTETTTAVNRFIMSANASIAKIFSFRSANLPRWAFRVDGTESGANAGADLAIRRYDDAGTFIDAPMSFDRSDGTASILKDATINGVKVGRGAGSIASNTALGFESLLNNTTGTQTTAIGYQALRTNNGDYNTAVGYASLYSNTAGYVNTGIGRQSLFSNTTGNENTAVGLNSMYSNVSGGQNTTLGVGSLELNVLGSANTALGFQSLYANTASNNTAVGYEAGRNNTSGNPITAVGYQSLRANTTGSDNVALGYRALYNNTTGSINTAIGDNAMDLNTTGSSNVVVGVSAQTGNFDSSIIFGRNATATASNQFVVGSAAYPAGSVATEVLVSDRSWAVKINGTDYKILLKS